jgi:hypothetical protein
MGTVQRQFCSDMMQVGWTGTNGFKETYCGIILEIDPAGGLVQTTVGIPFSSKIMLDTGMGLVQGHVTGCEKDPYGYIVNFEVDDCDSRWFPQFVPQFLHSSEITDNV